MGLKFVAKKDTWFDAGTQAYPITEFEHCFNDKKMTIPSMFAIFEGIRNGEVDEEDCAIDEFEIFEDPSEEDVEDEDEVREFLKKKNEPKDTETLDLFR